MRRIMLIEQQEIELPREALDVDFAHTGNIIHWVDLKTWEFLKYARAYCLANPTDIANKLVYKNLLNAYRIGH